MIFGSLKLSSNQTVLHQLSLVNEHYFDATYPFEDTGNRSPRFSIMKMKTVRSQNSDNRWSLTSNPSSPSNFIARPSLCPVKFPTSLLFISHRIVIKPSYTNSHEFSSQGKLNEISLSARGASCGNSYCQRSSGNRDFVDKKHEISRLTVKKEQCIRISFQPGAER